LKFAQTLSKVSAETIGLISTVNEAVHLIATEKWIDGAPLDVNLGK